MRILYADPNVWHLNPTANLLPILLKQQFADVTLYGPGYVTDEELKLGLLSFTETNGPFDVIIFGPGTSFFNKDADEDRRVAESLCKNSATRVSPGSLAAFSADVREHCGDVPVRIKLLSTLNLDYYASTRAQVDVLLEKSISVIGPNEQFVTALEDLPDYAMREKHYVRKQGRFSNAWREFLIQHPEMVVTALHFVSPNEFCFDSWASRPFEASIPGVEYVLRREAIQQLRKSKYRSPSKAYFNMYRVASRVGLPVYSNPVMVRLYSMLFRRSLAETRCIYTARGGFGIPIRKFFEIPAAGGLLICSPPIGFGDIGFLDQENYIEAQPDQLLDVLADWLDSESAQSVARRGQDLVIAKHSLSARGAQIAMCIEAMLEDKFKSARWQGGEFILQFRESDTCVA